MRKIFLSMTAGIFFWGCQSNVEVHESAAATSFQWDLPTGIYPPRVPADNPMTNEKVALGRFLFYDKRLSANELQSCESCHFQEFAFSDHNMVGIGTTGEHHIRNPMTLANSAFYTSYTWANPALGILEKQIILPITGDDPIELGVVDEEEAKVLARFENNETYRAMFKNAFPEVENPIKIHYIVKAISSFVRTLNGFNSPYDKYLRGEKRALSDEQKRGMELFMGEKAECFHCHAGSNFSDSTADEKSFTVEQFYHNIGLYNVGNIGNYPTGNEGLYEITFVKQDKGRFKAPTLRNVELSFPYMHDGSMSTLEEVIELHSNGGRNITSGIYAGNGINNPFISDFMTYKDFTPQEKTDLVSFLKALTDHDLIKNPKISNPFKEQK